MKKRKYYNNPKDLINETYNADAFPVIEKMVDPLVAPLVMPLNMTKDIDVIDSTHFYQETWDESISSMIKNKE